MLAKVKQESRYATLRLFCGREYGKDGWAEVPAGFENQALANDALETTSVADNPHVGFMTSAVEIAPPVGIEPIFADEVVELVEPAPVEEVPAEARATSRNRHGSNK